MLYWSWGCIENVLSHHHYNSCTLQFTTFGCNLQIICSIYTGENSCKFSASYLTDDFDLPYCQSWLFFHLLWQPHSFWTTCCSTWHLYRIILCFANHGSLKCAVQLGSCSNAFWSYRNITLWIVIYWKFHSGSSATSVLAFQVLIIL